MDQNDKMDDSKAKVYAKQPSRRVRNTVLFFVLMGLWLLLDIVTKQYFNSSGLLGEALGDSFLGIFHFRLVHNTGAAWGLFGGSTMVLGVMSAIVSLIIMGYFFFVAARARNLEIVGLALILAGGIGNGIDRFALGYVVDFIEFSFMQFPVFNVADIGVTCGFAMVVLSMLLSWRAESNEKTSVTSDHKEDGSL